MNRRDITEPTLNETLDAYREAAHAETDALFDDRALETQRHKILARLAHLGHPAKGIQFPFMAPAPVPAAGVNRRWISIAAAAGNRDIFSGDFSSPFRRQQVRGFA